MEALSTMTVQITPLHNVDTVPGKRYEQNNPYNLQFHHFALPTNNIELMAAFVREVFGGEIVMAAGFDEVDRSMGRKKHFFIQIGNVRLQCGEPQDGLVKIGKEDLNSWPHWAFDVTAAGLDEFQERLKAMRIPYFGPVSHRGGEGKGIYFASPEGHKFEIRTADPYPEEKAPVAGSPGVGHTDWSKLGHDWPNT